MEGGPGGPPPPADTETGINKTAVGTKMHVSKPKSFWENASWTDESKVELLGKTQEKKTIAVVKQGGSLKMFHDICR